MSDPSLDLVPGQNLAVARPQGQSLAVELAPGLNHAQGNSLVFMFQSINNVLNVLGTYFKKSIFSFCFSIHL